MAGHYLSDEHALAHFLKRIEACDFNQFTPLIMGFHPDELCGGLSSKEEQLQNAYNCFLELNKWIIDNGYLDKFMPALSVTLFFSEEINKWRKNIPISSQMIDGEPPSLYVVNRGFIKSPLNIEEYRYPLDICLPSNGKSTIISYYSCVRSVEEIELGEEYKCSLMVESYPSLSY